MAVDAGQLVPAQRLVERVWGTDTPRRGHAVLQSYVSRLRQALTEVDTMDIVHRAGGYALVVNQVDQAVDLHRFGELRTRAREDTDDAQAARLLAEALGLGRGEALTGLIGDWVDAERDRLRRTRLTVELDLIDARLRAGQGEQVVADLSARIARYPLDERVAGSTCWRCTRPGGGPTRWRRTAWCVSAW
nr:BTAD domain-containing putative transcriptional regulator [Kibdelosporangium phytohabitans]